MEAGVLASSAVLDSIFDEAGFGLALLDRDMRCVRVNATLARINGVRVEEHAGRPVSEVLPGIPQAVADASRRVLDTGETVRDVEVHGPLEDAIGPRVFECSYHPLREGDEVVGIWCSVREVTLDRRLAAAEQMFSNQLAEERRILEEEVADAVRRRLELEQELSEEHRIATELQVSLMPDRLPEVPGADLASGFRPAGDGHEIGGDFFDVFGLADECWLLVIGDVCGKGARAASLTALARYTLRAAAIQDGAEPARLLARLNEALLSQRDDMRFLTCVCAFLEPADGGALRLTVCVAGHPPPLKVDAEGEVSRVGAQGGLIGAWEDPNLEAEVVDLLPGERLILYTDGVVEAGAPHHDLSEEGLFALLRDAAGQSSAATVRAIEAAVAGGSGPQRDDIAVLVLRADPGAES